MVNNSGALGGSFDLHVWAKWLRKNFDLNTGLPRKQNPSVILPWEAQDVNAMVSVKCSTDGEPFEVSKWLFDSKTERFGDKAFFHCERHIQRGPRRR